MPSKLLSDTFFSFCVVTQLSGCNTSRSGALTAPNPASSSSTIPTTSTPTSTPDGRLTNSKVETAVADLLSDWRIGGSDRVRGIHENSQTNSAVADLQFNNFEYGVTFEGGIVRKKDFKPKKDSGKMIPDPDEMFPQRKVTYSKDGKATLSKYNDGRWVLKAVNWGFDTGVKGTVEIR